MRAKMHAAIEQIAFAREELAGVQELFDKGLERKPRVMSVKRYLAEVVGTRDEFTGADRPDGAVDDGYRGPDARQGEEAAGGNRG